MLENKGAIVAQEGANAIDFQVHLQVLVSYKQCKYLHFIDFSLLLRIFLKNKNNRKIRLKITFLPA